MNPRDFPYFVAPSQQLKGWWAFYYQSREVYQSTSLDNVAGYLRNYSSAVMPDAFPISFNEPEADSEAQLSLLKILSVPEPHGKINIDGVQYHGSLENLALLAERERNKKV